MVGIYYHQLKHDNAQPPQARKCKHRDDWVVFPCLPCLLPRAEAAQRGSLSPSSDPQEVVTAWPCLQSTRKMGRWRSGLEGVANGDGALNAGICVCVVYLGIPRT